MPPAHIERLVGLHDTFESFRNSISSKRIHLRVLSVHEASVITPATVKAIEIAFTPKVCRSRGSRSIFKAGVLRAMLSRNTRMGREAVIALTKETGPSANAMMRVRMAAGAIRPSARSMRLRVERSRRNIGR